MAYAELHCHSNFSFLDGASAPDELVERAAELGCPALAATDHQGLYGAVRFATAAEAAGIHPCRRRDRAARRDRPGPGRRRDPGASAGPTAAVARGSTRSPGRVPSRACRIAPARSGLGCPATATR